MKGSNNDGIWNEEGTTLEIVVLPPLWKTWWAYLFYAVVAIALIAFIIRYFTEKKRLQNNIRLKQMEAEVHEEYYQERNRLFTNFSHELRTPLTLIMAPLEEFVKRTDLTDDIHYKVKLMLRNAQRLLRIVNNLMDLQKNESGTMKLQVSENDMIKFTHEAVSSFQDLALYRNIHLKFKHSIDCQPVWFDWNLLEKVYFNFLSNAIKNTHEGAITLGLEVCGEWLKVYVTDTGCGIAKEKLPLIFNRFEKLNDFVQGTGLGLPICQSIVERLGGKISVESEVGVGSTFVMTLPYRQFVLGADGEPVEINAHVERRSDGRKKILIAEDTESNFMQINILLKKDYTISWVTNGEEAVNSFLRERPDLILMDIRMPVMNGIQATEKIRTIDIDLPIVAVTANAFLIEQQQALAAGCNDIIAKPYTYERLKETIIKYI